MNNAWSKNVDLVLSCFPCCQIQHRKNYQDERHNQAINYYQNAKSSIQQSNNHSKPREVFSFRYKKKRLISEKSNEKPPLPVRLPISPEHCLSRRIHHQSRSPQYQRINHRITYLSPSISRPPLSNIVSPIKIDQFSQSHQENHIFTKQSNQSLNIQKNQVKTTPVQTVVINSNKQEQQKTQVCQAARKNKRLLSLEITLDNHLAMEKIKSRNSCEVPHITIDEAHSFLSAASTLKSFSNKSEEQQPISIQKKQLSFNNNPSLFFTPRGKFKKHNSIEQTSESVNKFVQNFHFYDSIRSSESQRFQRGLFEPDEVEGRGHKKENISILHEVDYQKKKIQTIGSEEEKEQLRDVVNFEELKNNTKKLFSKTSSPILSVEPSSKNIINKLANENRQGPIEFKSATIANLNCRRTNTILSQESYNSENSFVDVKFMQKIKRKREVSRLI